MRGRIVVGVDGSACSVAALRWAIRQAELTDSALDVVGVWDLATSHGFVPPGWDFERETASMVDDAIGAAIEPEQRSRVRPLVRQGPTARCSSVWPPARTCW